MESSEVRGTRIVTPPLDDSKCSCAGHLLNDTYAQRGLKSKHKLFLNAVMMIITRIENLGSSATVRKMIRSSLTTTTFVR